MKVDTLAKQVLFSTVRITKTEVGGKQTVGTGFVFEAAESLDSDITIPLLVSNKHVFENALSLQFDFLARNADNTGPNLLKPLVHLQVGAAAIDYVGHPDPEIDVAVMPLGNTLLSMKPNLPYMNQLNWWHLPSETTVSNFDAIEELIFIGYPNGWADEFNHTPIVRQAITASPLSLPFDGKPTFLLDGSVFGGSSGSPVFILNRGSWTGPQGLMLGDRIHLVGIVAETLVRDSDLPVKTSTFYVSLSQELNLGVAFSSQAIIETVNDFLNQNSLPTGEGKS